MKNRRKKDKSILIWQYIIGTVVVLTVLAFSLLNIFHLSMEPYQSAKISVTKLAAQYAAVNKVDSFAIYNGKKSYYSLLGDNEQGEKVAVLVEKGSDKIYIYRLGDGTSQEKAESIAQENGATAVDKVTFGYLDNQPIWEVKSGGTYYNIGFESGQLIGKEGL